MPGLRDLQQPPAQTGGGLRSLAQPTDGVMPTEQTKGGLKSVAQPGISSAPQIKMPPMRTGQQMEAQMTTNTELPQGAIGFNPDGTPNYGSGIEGWWNGIQSRITATTDTGTAPTGLETTGRVAMEALKQIGDLFSIPQQAWFGYLADRRSIEMYADLVNQNSPDIYGDNELGNFLRLTTSIIPGISNLTTMYEQDRIKNGTRILPDGSFEKIQEANRIWNKENVGTSIMEPQVQAEYIRRVLAGDNPYELTKAMGSNAENLIGNLILDPMNLTMYVGWAQKALGIAPKVVETARLLPQFAEAADILWKADKSADVIDTIKSVAKTIVETSVEHVDEAKKIKGTLFELTQGSKLSVVLDRMKMTLLPIVRFVNGNAEKDMAVKTALAQLGSKDIAVVEEGLKFLVDNHLGQLFLNENGLTTARVLNKVLDEGSGFAGRALMEAVQAGEGELAAKELMKITEKVVGDLFPDINKIVDGVDEIEKIRKLDPLAEIPKNLRKFQDVQISKTARYIARAHKAMQESWLGTKFGARDINQFFSLIYLSSPGFTVRNYYNAAVTAIVDLGFGSLKELTDFSGGSTRYLEEMFGTNVDVITKAFSGAVETAKEGKKIGGILAPLEWIRSLGAKGESFESAAIAAHAGKKYSQEFLKTGLYIESMENLRKAQFSEESLGRLEKLVRKYNGQTGKAIEEFRQMFSSGTIEHFREPETIFSEQLINSINQWDPHLMDQLRDVMKSGTLEEITGKVDDILGKIRDKMFDGIDKIPVDATLEEYQAAIKAGQDFGIADDALQLDSFAKKANVRRDIHDQIVQTAPKVLSPEKNIVFQQIASRIPEDVRNVQNALGTTVRSVADRLSKGEITVAEAIDIVKKSPYFDKIGNKLTLAHSPASVKSVLWEYYKQYTEELWFDTIKQTYDTLKGMVKTEGFGAIKNENKLRALSILDAGYIRSQRYMASLLENGKVVSNDSYFWYQLGDRINSVYARAKELGLMRSAVQKGPELGKPIPYRQTVWDVINELKNVSGLGKIGDLNVEANYLQAMKVLDEYAFSKSKIDGALDVISQVEKLYQNTGAGVPEVFMTLQTKLKQIAKGGEGNIDDIINTLKNAVAEDDVLLKNANKTREVAKKALNVDEIVNGFMDTVKAKTGKNFSTVVEDIPVLDDGNMKTLPEALRENYLGFHQMMTGVKDGITKNYGRTELVSQLTRGQEEALKLWAARNEVKMIDFRTGLLAHMKGVRDFALLDYSGSKRNIDLMLAYMFPYQFWYSRSYMNWVKRLATQPNIVNNYKNFRKFIEKQNENLPEYMKNNVVLGKSIGMAENPLMLNLEATLNPLNGLTGIDFTDKAKIVGTPGTLEYAWTKSLDAMGKYGPGVWSPINMLTAGVLLKNGEREAAARWAGRLFPQSGPIKAVGSLFNQNWELDPFVMLFGDGSGTDPYESRRVGRALIAMSEAGKITKEQAYEAARTKSGQIWEQAVIFSTKNRALGTISAWALGQGFKVRSQNEAQIDKFYEEYFKMWANKDKFTPDEMSNYQRYIRTKYDFADLVILSGKGSVERDKAYSYSVLSRIAPGQTTDIMNALGVNPNLIDLFYTSKGDMTTWNPLDKENFMNAMVQIGTLVTIPKDTTIEQWQNVKTIYKQTDPMLVEKFGPDILGKIETYYELQYDNIAQKNFIEAHPEVQDALDFKDLLIAGNKDIAPYYDGLTRFERYFDGEFRRQVEAKIDPNYYEYYKIRGMIIDPKEQKAFDKKIGWDGIQKRYYAFKKTWDMNTFKALDQYDKFFVGQAIPTSTQELQNPSVGQQAIQDLLAPAQENQRQLNWMQIQQTIPMPITLDNALREYMTTERQFTSTENSMVGRLLNSVNDKFGLSLSKEELLSLAMDYYK